MFSKKFLLALLLLFTILSIAILATIKFSSSKQAPAYAPDYSWVIGELEYNPIEGGFWQIRFGKQDDSYNGKFVLGNRPEFSRFRHGDLVKITGRIAQNQVSIYQAGTLYQIESIQKLK